MLICTRGLENYMEERPRKFDLRPTWAYYLADLPNVMLIIPQSAHMAVIEALMQLFIKEQVSVDRVLSTVRRFSAPVATSEAPTDPDSALLLWTKRCCESLKTRMEEEMKSDEVNFD